MFYLFVEILCCLISFSGGLPLQHPTFTSEWYRMSSIPGRLNRVDIDHGLGEMPVFVHVQVKSIDEPNKNFLFPATGHILRDDDANTPYSGIVYLYNERAVIISTATANNQNRGRTIYTDNSIYWQGPNKQSSFEADVRVGVWKTNSFPNADFHISEYPIGVACDQRESAVCFYEIKHNFAEYPGFLIVRTKLKRETSPISGYMADAVGASHMAYVTSQYRTNGYVIYGFNQTTIRIWTDSSNEGCLFGSDGYEFMPEYNATHHIYDGELEIMAWRSTSIDKDYESSVELESKPGALFEMETEFQLQREVSSYSFILISWVEALDGSNTGFRFPGTGSMVYETYRTTSPCSYGGLVYAYTNTTLRLWRPGSAEHGHLICIANISGDGKYAQGSDNGLAVMKVWTVSDIGRECKESVECKVENSACINKTCECKDGYYESKALCKRELSCQDEVPNLSNLEMRQRNYIVEKGQGTINHVDDGDLQESWYTAENSEGQYLMPDSSTMPIDGSCGSLKAAFIKDTHPSIQDLREIGTEVAVQILNSTNAPLNIKIRKCNNSIQYRLEAVVRESFSFCFDGPSIQGQVEFEEAPDNADIDDLHVNPGLRFELKQNADDTITYDPFLVFMCAIDINAFRGDLLYTTYWFIDGKLLVSYGPTTQLTNLTESTLLYKGIKLGFQISCGVQMSTSLTGYKSKLVQSEQFFAGIKFTKTLVSLQKGGTTTLQFTATVPIGCSYTDPTLPICSKLLFLKPEDKDACRNGYMMIVNAYQTCGVQMKAFKQQENWEVQSYKFNVTTKDVNYNDRTFFRLHFVTDSNAHQIWRNYQPEDISIYVVSAESTKFAVCYSHVDPHMRTADKYLFEHQHEGEFILYRNVKYDIEVQMKTKICNRGIAYCACAVAVRAGGDVFLINLCGKVKFIGFTSCDYQEILQVKKETEKRYKVYTPIGTFIDIKIRPHPKYHNLMNIDVYMAPKDLNATEGLCGFYDNNIANELKKRNTLEYYPISTDRRYHYHLQYSNDWRIQGKEANYLHLDINPAPRWEHNLFCTCDFTSKNQATPETVCSPIMNANCPIKGNDGIKRCSENASTQRSERYRRSAMIYDKERQFPSEENKRQRRDITEAEAETICRTAITNHSTINSFRHRLIGFDLEGVVSECISDVTDENDESWADVYPEAMIEIIETFNEKEPKYVEENSDEVLQFKQMACPMNCSGQGICNQTGQCDCDDGFRASDCSIDISKPLLIDDIYGDGLCDVNENNTCDCFTVQTIDLIDGFQCRINERKVFINGSAAYDGNVLPGEYSDIYNGICCGENTEVHASEFAKIYNISISNDGKNFGDYRVVIVYNSHCQEIIDDEVRIKANTCFIDGVCFRENQTAIRNPCLLCQPNNYIFSWTYGCEPTGSFPLLLVLIISGVTAALLILVTLFMCHPLLSKKK